MSLAPARPPAIDSKQPFLCFLKIGWKVPVLCLCIGTGPRSLEDQPPHFFLGLLPSLHGGAVPPFPRPSGLSFKDSLSPAILFVTLVKRHHRDCQPASNHPTHHCVHGGPNIGTVQSNRGCTQPLIWRSRGHGNVSNPLRTLSRSRCALVFSAERKASDSMHELVSSADHGSLKHLPQIFSACTL